MTTTFDTPELAEAAAIKYAYDNFLIPFDGQNCNDYLEDDEPECGGWDGESRRCSCGNRRVYWDIQKVGDKFVAEATAD